MTLRDLWFLVRLPFAAALDLARAVAEAIDTRLADSLNTTEDE